MQLPTEYISYFASDQPKEGGLAVDPGWFQLWAPDEVEQWNQDYQVLEDAPGFMGFGSNGGGELLAFDHEGKIFMLPFIGMSPAEAILVAASWDEFVAAIKEDEA